MKKNAALFTSKSAEWATPQELFDRLELEFRFNLDPCASHDNHKCKRYFTREDDGLAQPWYAGRVFMNPPYGREIGKWIDKAIIETSVDDGALFVVALVPARTDTKWWFKAVKAGAGVVFLRGRLKFGGSKNSAPFPSALLLFRNKKILI